VGIGQKKKSTRETGQKCGDWQRSGPGGWGLSEGGRGIDHRRAEKEKGGKKGVVQKKKGKKVARTSLPPQMKIVTYPQKQKQKRRKGGGERRGEGVVKRAKKRGVTWGEKNRTFVFEKKRSENP